MRIRGFGKAKVRQNRDLLLCKLTEAALYFDAFPSKATFEMSVLLSIRLLGGSTDI